MFPEDSQGDVLGFGILQGTIKQKLSSLEILHDLVTPVLFYSSVLS